MDDTLRKDIEKEYASEYYQAARQRRTGFWKSLSKYNDGIENFFNKFQLDAGGGQVLTAILLGALWLPAGIAAGLVLLADAALTINANGVTREESKKDIARDIDNGVLQERYSAVLDTRMKDLTEKLSHYAEQKSQLPAKGSAVNAFTAAVADTSAAPATPAPAAPAPTTPAL